MFGLGIFEILMILVLLGIIGAVVVAVVIVASTGGRQRTLPRQPADSMGTGGEQCASCGQMVDITDRFCRTCGNPLSRG